MLRRLLVVFGFVALVGGAPLAAKAMPVDAGAAVAQTQTAAVDKAGYYRRPVYRRHFVYRPIYRRPYYRPVYRWRRPYYGRRYYRHW